MGLLAYFFHTAPFHSCASREGLDALLAASAFCDEQQISLFFIGEGILNLLPHQQANKILQRNHNDTFKLLELYDIEQRYLCLESLQYWQIQPKQLLIRCHVLPYVQLIEKLQQHPKILSF